MRTVLNFIIPRWVACFFIAQMALPGCASYQAKPAPMPVPEIMPYSYSDRYLEVYADPYLQLDRQRKYFDAELTKLGVIPIQVFVRNKSDWSFALAYDDIWLELLDGTQITRAPSSHFFSWKGPRPQETPKTIGSSTAPQLDAIVLMTAPIWGPFAYMAYKARTDRLADYKDKEFNAIVLGKDESGNGFIFFVIPPDADIRDTQTLVFRFVEEYSMAVIRLRLNGLTEGTETVGSPHPPER
jgi:hypothetical protein